MKLEKVLIIDDSSTSRMIIQRCLDIAGFSVAEYHYAENGLDALGIVKVKKDLDLIITDINMPKIDGPTFIKVLELDDTGKTIPILVVSSIGDSAMEDELKALGVSGIIKKPLSPAKLIETLGGRYE
ncbi:MAG TPA: response regulator [Spirochaetia bacterium]|nr:response regulator [Spirochaetia bacterium]